QRQLNVLRSAGVQDVEEHALPFLYTNRLAISQTFAVDRKSLIPNLPAIRLLLLLLLFLLFARKFRVFVLFFHFFGPEKGFEFVRGQKDFLVISAGILFRLDVNESELSGISTPIQVAHRHHVSMYESGASGLRR